MSSARDGCGVLGTYGYDGAARQAYLGLYSLQHRGEESDPDHLGRPDHLAHCLSHLEGAFSLLMMTKTQLIAARDRHGFRPLSLGELRCSPVVASDRVVCGLSGGIDSTVVASLVHRAIGEQLTCIFVDNGLVRASSARNSASPATSCTVSLFPARGWRSESWGRSPSPGSTSSGTPTLSCRRR